MARTPMPERDGRERALDFDEVNLGYTDQLAILEATRCLQCARPVCVDGCPVGVKINDFVAAVAAGRFDEASRIVAADNSLPAICGRVCPQEAQCEGACVMGRRSSPIAIGHLERFVADRALADGSTDEFTVEPSGRSVAVVGSGPAGLACAADLARLGHSVTVYEALHAPGGVLAYGIPEYRLPEAVVDAEVGRLEQLGVIFEMNAPIGRAEGVDDLLERHDAVFIGIGAGLPQFLDVPGESLVGVQSANEFLTRVNLMGANRADAETPVLVGKRVAVIGGGNTALDAVRTALRAGANSATVYYRRTEDEMPARTEEIRHAREEGVHFEFLLSPVSFGGSDRVDKMTLVRMRQTEAGEDGRRGVEQIEGTEVDVPVDTVVVAVGNAPNPMLANTPGLSTTRWGTIITDEQTGATQKAGVFAGGDIVTGGATVILAMGAGRRAARGIARFLEQTGPLQPGSANERDVAASPAV